MVPVNKGEWDRSQGLEFDHAFNRNWLRVFPRTQARWHNLGQTGTLHVYLSVGMAMLEEGFRILNDIVWEKPEPAPEPRLPLLYALYGNDLVGHKGVKKNLKHGTLSIMTRCVVRLAESK